MLASSKSIADYKSNETGVKLDMTLDEVRPSPSSFRLEVTGDAVYTFRNFSLDDQVWIKKTFGKGLAELMGGELDPIDLSNTICQVAYHMLGDKSPFKSKTIKTYDDNGQEISVTIGGAKLLASMIQAKDSHMLVAALLEAIKASNPPEPEKKTEKKDKKNNQ